MFRFTISSLGKFALFFSAIIFFLHSFWVSPSSNHISVYSSSDTTAPIIYSDLCFYHNNSLPKLDLCINSPLTAKYNKPIVGRPITLTYSLQSMPYNIMSVSFTVPQSQEEVFTLRQQDLPWRVTRIFTPTVAGYYESPVRWKDNNYGFNKTILVANSESEDLPLSRTGIWSSGPLKITTGVATTYSCEIVVPNMQVVRYELGIVEDASRVYTPLLTRSVITTPINAGEVLSITPRFNKPGKYMFECGGVYLNNNRFFSLVPIEVKDYQNMLPFVSNNVSVSIDNPDMPPTVTATPAPPPTATPSPCHRLQHPDCLEPNNSFDEPQQLPVSPITLVGTLQGDVQKVTDDRDFFLIPFEAGKRYAIQLDPLSEISSDTAVDLYVFDGSRRKLADALGNGAKKQIVFTAGQSDRFFILVTAFHAPQLMLYKLEITPQ